MYYLLLEMAQHFWGVDHDPLSDPIMTNFVILSFSRDNLMFLAKGKLFFFMFF